MADTLAGALIEAQAKGYTGRTIANEELIINDQTRTIQIPSNELLFGVESDEKAERKYFRCPRYVGDNIDLMEMGIQVNYRNAKGEEDIYIVSDKETVEDSEDITFSWLLSRKVTRYKGQVTFIICATRLQDNKVINEWNTTLARGNVIEGLEVNDILIEEPEIDVLRQLIQLTEEMSTEAKQASKMANESLTEVQETSAEVSMLKIQLEGIIEQATDLLDRLDGLDKKAEITYKVVTELPEVGENGVFYFVPHVTKDADNAYDEYMWIESTESYEFLGGVPEAEIWVDDILSETSENPVQNKVITEKFNNLLINNLTTTTPGQGALDAYQGYLLEKRTNGFKFGEFYANSVGWHTLLTIQDSGILTNTTMDNTYFIVMQRKWGNIAGESITFILYIGHGEKSNICVLQRNGSAFLITGIRVRRESTNITKVDIHYNSSIGNPIAFNVIAPTPFEAVTSKELSGTGDIIYEYTFEKPIFNNMKSLTQFTEIPSGADLKSATYLVPGNYACPSNNTVKTLSNCPITEGFTLTVKYANGLPTYIKQIFESFSGKIKVERVHGTSSNVWDTEYTYTGNSAINPTGTIISYMGNTAPTGYLKCDGTVYNISQYQNLANHFNTEFGSKNYFGGNGTTTFAVPDLRGEFLRGTDTAARNTGSGADVGVHQDATSIPQLILYGSAQGYLMQSRQPATGSYIANTDTNKKSTTWINYTKSNMGTDVGGISDYTTRPTNTSVLYCIKY